MEAGLQSSYNRHTFVFSIMSTQAEVVSLEPVSLSTLDHVNLFGPGPRGWWRAGTSFLAVLTLVLVGIQFMFTMYHSDVADPDVWWHMRNAEFLLQHHQLPRQDTYSFTVAGRPWVNTEWLSEIPFYVAYRTLGLVGLETVTFLLPTTVFLLLLYLCYKESLNFKASIAACCFTTFLAKVSYGPRTILFGYLFLVVLLIILRKFRDEGHAPLWVVPPLFCVWANTHGSWALGLILFFLIGVSGVFAVSWGRVQSVPWSAKQLRQLIVVGGASVAALFINPFGWRLVYYPFDLAFKQKLNISHVQEWISVNFQDMRGNLVFVLIAVLLCGALFRSRRWDLGELLMLIFALHTALSHIRFLVLLAIVASPVLAKVLDFFPPYRPEFETPKTNLVVITLILAAIVYVWPRNSQLQNSLSKNYPVGAVNYLTAHPIQGNILNFYLWGGYLDWNSRENKVFVDSRVDIFEYAGVMMDYLKLLTANPIRPPDELLDKYHIQYVLFPPSDSKNPNLDGGFLMYVLEHDPNWKTIYRDKVSVILERVAAKTQK